MSNIYYTTAIVEIEKGQKAGKWLQLHVSADSDKVQRLQSYSKGIRVDNPMGAVIVHKWMLEMHMHSAIFVVAFRQIHWDEVIDRAYCQGLDDDSQPT